MLIPDILSHNVLEERQSMAQSMQLEKRLHNLESHLQMENPILLHAVQSFRKLDKIAHRMGLLSPEESYATRVPWWPIIAVLGVYSSGKSTFINHYLGYDLQRTGNQAVDDKFTVICFSSENTVRTLPGLALDADPRFPFYQMSRALEEITVGEGRRIDAYLQLKTCPSERVRGKILIDSPGFDADAQRTSTLRMSRHIIDLSDLVLVLFDARHPEPGTMHDTLEHLVSHTIHRPDSSKFLYILNQIDTTAREDNPEDVAASWQRALAQKGLTAGRFYRIYNPDAAVPIEDDNLRERFEAKRDADLAEIHARMYEVEVERAYRVVAILEQTARDVEEKIVDRLQKLITHWRRRVLWTDGLLFGTLVAALLTWTFWTAEWTGLSFTHPFWAKVLSDPVLRLLALGVVLGLGAYGHFTIRRLAAKHITTRLQRDTRPMAHDEFFDGLTRAFHRNTRWWRSVFCKQPTGWGHRTRRLVKEVLTDANYYVQELNNKFTNPSGTSRPAATPAYAAPVAEKASTP
jgi:GTPase Era involved in 16S rRNA processing